MSRFAIPMAFVEQMVCSTYRISRIDLLSARKRADIVLPRQVLMWAATKLTALSLPQIGRCLCRDHTTVLHGARVIEAKMARDPEFAVEMEVLLQIIVHAAQSGISARPVDAAAAATRVAEGGARFAIGLSTLEIVAICARATALEEVAGGVFLLLRRLDQFADAQPEGRPRLGAEIEALTETLASALAALGYNPEIDDEDPQDQNRQDEGRSGEPARAAE